MTQPPPGAHFRSHAVILCICFISLFFSWVTRAGVGGTAEGSVPVAPRGADAGAAGGGGEPPQQGVRSRGAWRAPPRAPRRCPLRAAQPQNTRRPGERLPAGAALRDGGGAQEGGNPKTLALP
eukprot:7577225-Pyramimonas_sp.AAC.2